MEIISVDNNWKDDVLGIYLSIGNVCNYRCSYCWPNSNTGNYKFPNVDLLKVNISHLINYYLEHTNKKKFAVHFIGGEPTHWPKFLEFIKFLKDNFNCLISLSTNGSKKLEWWNDAAPYIDRIVMSCHHEYVDIDKFTEVCDLLYKKNVVVDAFAMMDPRAWDKCLELVERMKQSKYSWSIKYLEIIHKDVTYTEEQKKVLESYRARRVNLFWFLKNNKYYLSKVRVTDTNNKKHQVGDNYLLLNKMNNFLGWECDLGVDWLHIDFSGDITGACGQVPYNEPKPYNIHSTEFMYEFAPVIKSTVCNKQECFCESETVMPKRKIIPIHAN